jgi:hypothetical protein
LLPTSDSKMRDEAPGTEASSQFKAFVGGIPYHMTNEDLRKGGFPLHSASVGAAVATH